MKWEVIGRRAFKPPARVLEIVVLAIFFGGECVQAAFLKETFFSDVVSIHNLLSFAPAEDTDPLYPTRLLEIGRQQLTFHYITEDIVQVKENGVRTNYLKQETLETHQSLPLRLFSSKSVISLGNGISNLGGKISALSMAQLDSDHNFYSGALATRLGWWSLGLSYRYRKSTSFGDIGIEQYHRSGDPLENDYFWNLLEQYFGKDMRLAEDGTEKIYAVENKVRLGSDNSFAWRFNKISTDADFSLIYSGDLGLRHIDSPLDISSSRLEFEFQREIRRWCSLKFLFHEKRTDTRLDLIPRDVNPETEIIDLGDVSLAGRGLGYGISTSFGINRTTRLFGGFYNSQTTNHAEGYFSTPVLGLFLGFLPIIHRLKAQADYGILAKQWQLGVKKEFAGRLTTDFVMNYQYLDIPLHVGGETNLGAGLVSGSFDKTIDIIGARLLYGYTRVEYRLSRNIKIAYLAELTVPIFPKITKDTFGASEPEPETEIAPPAPTEESPAEKSIRGGIAQQISLRYFF
ncbi:MAG: hypothetical protein HY547_08420 [Elusimicrobia bacterium]|nr:hypothetical protein [Elusimicrobiota bacterium]